jgi:hypothetical protein
MLFTCANMQAFIQSANLYNYQSYRTALSKSFGGINKSAESTTSESALSSTTLSGKDKFPLRRSLLAVPSAFGRDIKEIGQPEVLAVEVLVGFDLG